MKIAMVGALMLTGCMEQIGEDCRPDPVEIEVGSDGWLDPELCPEDVPGEPWEATCGRAYMLMVDQPDGHAEAVCVRARDCECLAEWFACTGEPVYVPRYCGL